MSAVAGMQVSTESDPTPLVKIFANKFKKALEQPEYASAISHFSGSFALQSTADPQSITVDVQGGVISIRHGVQSTAKIIVHLNFNKPANPKVQGLFRHPLFSMKVSRLLNFPTLPWTVAAEQFWERNHCYPGMPKGIRITCTTDDQVLLLGEEHEVTITGAGDHIAEVFSGNTVFIQSFVTGKLQVDSSFEHAVVLSDVSVQMLLGDR